MQHIDSADLDALVADVRAALVLRPPRGCNADALAASTASWLGTLLRCVHHAADCNQCDADCEDVSAVLALTLAACARSAIRRVVQLGGGGVREERDPFSRLLFQAESITTVVAFLARLVRASSGSSNDSDDDDDDDERWEAIRSASEVLFAMNQLASSRDELTLLLGALRRDPVFPPPAGGRDAFWRAVAVQELTRDERLAVCFSRFVSDALAGGEEICTSSEVPVLIDLVGDDADRWEASKWEQSWHLHHSPSFCHRAFGTSSDCVAMAETILRGFSIPQVDADSAQALDLASFLLAVDLDDMFGLRHGVDVTLVRDGALHPNFATGDALLFDDIMDAFANKYTVGIRGVHARSHRIAAVCRALQVEMAQHVNANIYWTPPGEQGFDLHIDDHCVFVIQLKGMKNWQLKPHVGVLPVLYSDLGKPLDVGPTEHIVLEPGNVLYIPRGTPHCADTRGLDGDSLHLTIGVEIEAQFTKGELVTRVFPQGEAHIRLREQLEAALVLESAQSLVQGGLMSWHLASNSALHRELTSLLHGLAEHVDRRAGAETRESDLAEEWRTLVKSALGTVITDDGAEATSLRVELLEDRRSFLSSREQLTDRFVCLHRCLDAFQSVERVSGSTRARKKARCSS